MNEDLQLELQDKNEESKKAAPAVRQKFKTATKKYGQAQKLYDEDQVKEKTTNDKLNKTYKSKFLQDKKTAPKKKARFEGQDESAAEDASQNTDASTKAPAVDSNEKQPLPKYAEKQIREECATRIQCTMNEIEELQKEYNYNL